jgi:hypothetical protein
MPRAEPEASGGSNSWTQSPDRERSLQSGNGGGIVNRVKESAAAQLTSQKNRGIDALGSVAQAVRSTTGRLRQEKHDTIAGYAEQAAGHIEQWSQRLREKDIDQLVGDVHRLVRRQPGVFIGSAFTLGLLAARFVKSSRPQNTYAGRREMGRSQYGGSSVVDTVHDTGVSHVGASSAATASRMEPTSPTDSGKGPRSDSGRSAASRTERS